MTDKRQAIYEVMIRGTIDAVWKELIRTDRPQRAMFNSVLHTDRLAAGGQLRMRSPDGKYTSVVGEYIEVNEPVRMVHTMRFTTTDDPECVVTFDLEDTPEGVRLRLTVDEIPVGTKSEKHLRQGAEFIARNLKAIVETGQPTFGARMLYVLFKVLAPFNPKRTRSEFWPLESST